MLIHSSRINVLVVSSLIDPFEKVPQIHDSALRNDLHYATIFYTRVFSMETDHEFNETCHYVTFSDI